MELFENKELENERDELINEAIQLRKIFSAMIKKLD